MHCLVVEGKRWAVQSRVKSIKCHPPTSPLAGLGSWGKNEPNVRHMHQRGSASRGAGKAIDLFEEEYMCVGEWHNYRTLPDSILQCSATFVSTAKPATFISATNSHANVNGYITATRDTR